MKIRKKIWAPLAALIIGTIFSAYSGSSQPKKSVQLPSPTVKKAKPQYLGAHTASQIATVVKVVDGDTIEVEIDGQKYKVRYIGIDTPETKDPRKPVQCFGKEAYEKNKELIEGKTVRMEKDISETDKYGRLLRYVYIQDSIPGVNETVTTFQNQTPSNSPQTELFINAYLIKEGYARLLTYPPDVSHADEFKELQKDAMNNKKGLWSKC